MIRDDYRAWDECPHVDDCELIVSFLELVDAMVKNIQHLKAETITARYELGKVIDPDHEYTTTVDILSDLEMPHYDNLAYQEYIRIYYDGGDPMCFKEHVDSMICLAEGGDKDQSGSGR